MKIIAENKKAYFDYFVEDRFEAGITLEGSEVKSIRAGNVNLKDTFALIRNGEILLKNAHIARYDKANAFVTSDTRRDRKLLMHKYEIRKLESKIKEKGFTLIALKMYFKDSLVKVELGLCKGKQQHDKRKTISERETNRETQRILKEYNR